MANTITGQYVAFSMLDLHVPLRLAICNDLIYSHSPCIFAEQKSIGNF